MPVQAGPVRRASAGTWLGVDSNQSSPLSTLNGASRNDAETSCSLLLRNLKLYIPGKNGLPSVNRIRPRWLAVWGCHDPTMVS